MIALGAKCMLFQTSTGESVPLSSDMISIELTGGAETMFEADFVDNAASAVFHYFKHDLKRESVTVAEFAEALEKALATLGRESTKTGPVGEIESDLRKLALECGTGCELVFFSRLRSELRELLKASPQTLRFSGLRECVKSLTGARRWSTECKTLNTQIVAYLRECLIAERCSRKFSVVVE